jgi:5-methyltetrahydropteroyltriglutamate--homocysteine methyltransferase
MAELPLIPSTVVGSHGKAAWWYTAVKALEAGEFGPGDLEEMFDDAADTAIRDMERAGLDIITDGEVRRLDGYVDSYYAIIKGISPLPVRRKVGPWGYDQQTRYEAVSRIETPEGGLGIVKEFEYAKAHTGKRLKATCAGPLTFGSRIHPGKTYKGVVDVAERFAEVINTELKALVAAGADIIQLDEPARGNVSGEEMARLYNLATEGVKARLGFHVCFGNRFGRSRFDRSYRPYFPGPAQGARGSVRARVRGARARELDVCEGVRRGARAGARRHRREGLLHGPADGRGQAHPPRPRRSCPRRQALCNPDCGFGWSHPATCGNQKIGALAAGARSPAASSPAAGRSPARNSVSVRRWGLMPLLHRCTRREPARARAAAPRGPRRARRRIGGARR